MYIQVIKLLETEGAPDVADSGGPPANGRWGQSATVYVQNLEKKYYLFAGRIRGLTFAKRSFLLVNFRHEAARIRFYAPQLYRRYCCIAY